MAVDEEAQPVAGSTGHAVPELRGDRVVLLPVDAGDADDLRRIRLTPEVRRRWGDEAQSPEWPFDDPTAVGFSVWPGHDPPGIVRVH